MHRLLLSSTCFGGFPAENVPGTTGIFFTFFRIHCTRLKTTSSEISFGENLDGSVFLGTETQAIPEPAMAEFFASSSQT